jgi:hypothetical protein
MLKREEVNDDPALTPGGEKPAPAAKDAPAPEESGDSYDDLGYPIVKDPEEGKAPEGGPPKEKEADEPETPASLEKSATGYGDEPPVVEDLPPIVPPVPPAAPDEFDKVLEGLDKDDVTKVKEFAKANKMSVEQVKAYGELRKKELADAKVYAERLEKEEANQVLKQRAAWHKELVDDPAFGGEKYKANVSKVDKVLEKHMPNFKKQLTERGGVMPPYIMRDMAKLYDHLYGTEKLVQGEAPAPKPKDDEDPLDFYNSKES